jgi:hypothetical protein
MPKKSKSSKRKPKPKSGNIIQKQSVVVNVNSGTNRKRRTKPKPSSELKTLVVGNPPFQGGQLGAQISALNAMVNRLPNTIQAEQSRYWEGINRANNLIPTPSPVGGQQTLQQQMRQIAQEEYAKTNTQTTEPEKQLVEPVVEPDVEPDDEPVDEKPTPEIPSLLTEHANKQIYFSKKSAYNKQAFKYIIENVLEKDTSKIGDTEVDYRKYLNELGYKKYSQVPHLKDTITTFRKVQLEPKRKYNTKKTREKMSNILGH